MKKALSRSGLLRTGLGLIAGATFAVAGPAQAEDKKSRSSAHVVMDGFQEAPNSIFTDGRGSVRLIHRGDRIDYVLRYRGLTGDVTTAAGVHIHFGRPATTGGVAAFLCEAAIPGPPGTPACASDAAGPVVIRGSLRDADVLAVADQGFPGGDLDDLWEIVTEDAAYVNLHTDAFPSGEIRGDFRSPLNFFGFFR